MTGCFSVVKYLSSRPKPLSVYTDIRQLDSLEINIKNLKYDKNQTIWQYGGFLSCCKYVSDKAELVFTLAA